MLPITISLSLCLPFLVAAAPPVLKRAANPTVTIASGTIIGTATRVSNQPTVTGLVNAYLGVPFASPPERFAPPTAPQPLTTPLVAQTLPPACLQQFPSGIEGEQTRTFFNNPTGPPPAESEDCLYLNVFAPQDASPSKPKPVMFWLFGGNLQFGTASLAFYNGSSLAVNEDVVVVVPNYRTNIFGFSNSPEIAKGQQNSGFLDQRFALQWVQQNIKQFGGDPAQVTLFGESAGGFSIKQLLAEPPSPLPFRAAIMESQQTAVTGNGLNNYNNVSAHFGCSTAASTLACLRKVEGTAIRDYIIANNLGFPPVANDGTYLTSVLPSITSGQFANVPILIGTNKDEFRVFLAVLGLDGTAASGTDLIEDSISAGDLLSLPPLNFSSVQNTLLSKISADVSNDTYLLLSRILTDFAFTCTTQTLSAAIATAGRQPVWRYRYDGVFPNLSLFPNAGAYHTVEIPEVWGTYPLANQFGTATATQVALSKYMQGVWAGFAKNPSAGPGWPRLGSALGVELGDIGGPQPAGEQTVALATADYLCPTLDPLILALGMGY